MIISQSRDSKEGPCYILPSSPLPRSQITAVAHSHGQCRAETCGCPEPPPTKLLNEMRNPVSCLSRLNFLIGCRPHIEIRWMVGAIASLASRFPLPPSHCSYSASKYNPVERRCSQQTERPTRNTDYLSVLSTWQFSDHICRQYASFYSIRCLPNNFLTMLTANILGFSCLCCLPGYSLTMLTANISSFTLHAFTST